MKPRSIIARTTRLWLILSLVITPLLAQPLPAAARPQQQTTNTTGWFPFTPQGSDSAKTWSSAADLLLDSPTDNPTTLIDQRGFVRTDANGHFVFSNTGRRVRFWATNIGASAAFPPSPNYPPQAGEAPSGAAGQLAARLAKLGFNAVRLHHLDNPNWAGDGSGTLWQAAGDNTLVINPAQLDRLDHLIYQLKRQAIYVDLNLHVSRTFVANDGLTAADELNNSSIEFSKNVTIFDPVAIALQQRFAEQLLTHVNPYTGLAYKDDPVIFTTETTNEDSLFMGMVYDQLNHRPGDGTSLPQFYSQELDGWSSLSGGAKINRLQNPAFEGGSAGWETYAQDGAAATVSIVNSGVGNSKALRIRVDQRGPNAWSLQLAQPKLAVLAGSEYELSFAVRATQAATIYGMVMRNADPWDGFGWGDGVSVTTAWRTYSTTFTANQTNFGQARLSFDLGNLPAGSMIFFDNFVLREKAAFRGWHGWLQDKYGSTTAIRTAWAPSNPLPETELLLNPSFESGLTSWHGQTFENAQATFTIDATTATNGVNSVKIVASQLGQANWHIQLGQGGFPITQGQLYRIAFDAKASTPGTIDYGVIQNHDPYNSLGFYGTAALTTQWQSFEGFLRAEAAEPNALLNLDLGQSVRTIWIDNVSVKPYNPRGLRTEETLEANNIERVPRSRWNGFTPQRMRDTIQFYADIEAAYFVQMRNYLRNSLGGQALNGGTANYFDNLAHLPGQAALDFVDNHYYWDHPWWPEVPPWSPTGWVINNKAMINGAGASGSAIFYDLFSKAALAVKGKPFTITEFNAVTPNRYEVEGPLLLATFANLQDWDGIFQFAYTDTPNTYNATGLRNGAFFDVTGNPIDSSVLPIAARLFLSGQTAPAPVETLLRFTRNETLDSTAAGYAGGVNYFLQSIKGVDPAAAFGSRLRIANFAAATPATLQPPTPGGPRYVSGGNQLIWDITESGKARYLINAPQMQGVVGFVNGKSFTLPNLRVTVSGVPAGAPANANFGAITLQSLSADPLARARVLLLGAITRFENTGMVWNDTFTSVDDRWGSAPTLVEPIRFVATLTIDNPERVVVRTLDASGAPRTIVAHQVVSSNQIRFTVDTGRDKTLWYAIDKSGNSGSISGTVTTNGAALGGARASVYLQNGTQWQIVAGANTDNAGRYLINNLVPGVYRVGFRKTGYATRYYNNATAIRNGANITVNTGATTANINGSLPALQTLQDDVLTTTDWRLQATVRDGATGAPLPNATVTLYQIPGWQPQSHLDGEAEGVCLAQLSPAWSATESPSAALALGEWVAPAVEEDVLEQSNLTPPLNPQNSDGEGRLGWTTPSGCWYVTVEAVGYQPLISPVVGILDEPVALDLPLTPHAPMPYQLYLPLNTR